VSQSPSDLRNCAPPEMHREVPLDVIEIVDKVARLVELVEHRRAGGTNWKITLEANGERVAQVERDCHGLRVAFISPAPDEEQHAE
jgi:hypothetical protein